MFWEVLDTGSASAEQNMQIDKQLLDSLPSLTHGILHFYDWDSNSATYGYFMDPYRYLNSSAIKKYGIQLAKRPTGGGIIFHLWDFAFSLLVPASHPCCSLNTLENYAFVNCIVAKALSMLLEQEKPHLLATETPSLCAISGNFCMAKPTVHDVMINGRKIAGGAQRRTKHGFLHQGTISLVKPVQEHLNSLLDSNSQVIEDMNLYSFALLSDPLHPDEMKLARQELRRTLIDAVNEI